MNLNILKDIQGMKQLLEQSILKNNAFGNQNNSKVDFQPNMGIVDSQVFNSPLQQPDHLQSQPIQHSFGVEFDKVIPTNSSPTFIQQNHSAQF